MAKSRPRQFTDKEIKNLKPDTKEYWLREGQGFCIRVLPSGEKIWYYIYTFDKRKKYLRLGDGNYPDVSLKTAREQFDIAKVKVKNGVDPLAEKEQAKLERTRTPFVSDFVDDYIKDYAKVNLRRWKEVERVLKTEIVSRWGRRKITDVKRRDLIVILDEIKARAPIMSNRVLAYTRALFSYANECEVLDANPFLGVKARSPAKVRKRNLSFDEIETLWRNLETARMSDAVKRVLKLILVTGQRPGEVIGMHAREIDKRWWTIPEERSKNGLAHRVYLTDLALSLIGDTTGKGYIFESPTTPDTPYEVRTLTRNIKLNLPHTPTSKVEDRLKIPHFVPHDLRRTFSSRMAEMKFREDIVDRVQNHVTMVHSGVRKNYNHYTYDREKKATLEAWEQVLLSTIDNAV